MFMKKSQFAASLSRRGGWRDQVRPPRPAPAPAPDRISSLSADPPVPRPRAPRFTMSTRDLPTR
jgi:hypothetical protein